MVGGAFRLTGLCEQGCWCWQAGRSSGQFKAGPDKGPDLVARILSIAEGVPPLLQLALVVVHGGTQLLSVLCTRMHAAFHHT